MTSKAFLVSICWLIYTCSTSCCNQKVHQEVKLQLGNQQTAKYLPLLQGKNIGVVVNQTSLVDTVHLVDTLLQMGVKIQAIFAPEHGFRGVADAGELIGNGVDTKTKIPIISLYGKNKKPLAEQLKGLDWVLFDIQDVGVRFYTYLSTLHYVMEACAENNVKLMVLDRPNPNGDYVDGPVLDMKYKSFVGMHPIPIVHGMTLGELALMINGEGWLKNQVKCNLTIVPVEGYHHQMGFSVGTKPSPNLPNDISIRLYPSLCFFEATKVSIGRGTMFPFQVVGYPDSCLGSFAFTPQSIDGMAKSPLHQNTKCYGIDLRDEKMSSRFTLHYLIQFNNKWPLGEPMISDRNWFNLLAGNDTLLKQIEAGMTEELIRQSWQVLLVDFKQKRQKYLLYNE